MMLLLQREIYCDGIDYVERNKIEMDFLLIFIFKTILKCLI